MDKSILYYYDNADKPLWHSTAMTKNTRRILFYVATVLFFIIGIAALFYSNGWRFDLETFSVNKLGGIYFEKIPDGAQLTIEKMDLQFNPGFFKSSVLIANLFPKTYTAHAVKDGFQPWLKQISVQPSLVTEIDPIIMLPLKPASTTLISGKVTNFWVGSPGIITQAQNGSLLFQTHKIAGATVIAWSDDGKSVITAADNSYFLINLDDPESALNLTPAFSNVRKTYGLADTSRITTLAFQPKSGTSLIAQTGKGLYLFDTDRFRISTVASDTVLSFAAHDKEIIFSTEKSLSAYDSDAKTAAPISVAGSVTAPIDIRYNDNGSYFTLQNAHGKLVLVNRQDLTSAVLAENAEKSLFAPNTLKIAILTSDKELIIYTFGKGYQVLDQPKTEILRIGGENENTISWHKNASYLFTQYPDALYLLEANAMPPINLQKIYPDIQSYSYDAENNLIYILKNGSLFTIASE